MNDTILEAEGLRVMFRAGRGELAAVRDVSFSLRRGRTLALVGESGSGKSVTSLAIMGLLPTNGRIAAGRLTYRHRTGEPVDLVALSDDGYRRMRGSKISMIFQEPMSSLNPLFTIGDQVSEMLLLHEGLDAKARQRRTVEMLELVEIPAAASRANSYPHELSGGMRQRAMIAMALVCNPALLIADEPTTALDVTIQAQILDLMRRLQSELGMSILFITHDIGVVAEMADDVAVMYAGALVEQAPVGALFEDTRHPYTQGLLNSIPQPGGGQGERLVPVPGAVPPLHDLPPGCAFAPRCGFAQPECGEPIALRRKAHDHWAACILERAGTP